MRSVKSWSIGLILLSLLLSPPTVAAAGKPDRPVWNGKAIRGEVVAVAPPSLTVQTPRGPVLVLTDEETTFRIPGIEDPSLEDIQVGDPVVCLGQGGRGHFRARFVAVVDGRAQRDRVGGQVVSVDGNDIDITTPSGDPVRIHTDADTVFRIPGVEDPGPDDVAVGSVIAAVGQMEEDGIFHAALVVVPRAARREGRLTGQVVAIEGTSLVVQTAGGRQFSLSTDADTAFHVPGVEDATLADVHAGDRITAQVRLEEGILYAAVVAVWPDRPGRLQGTVAAIEGAVLTLETAHGRVQVITDGSTVFRVPGVEDPSLADVQVGDRVGCGGTWVDEATFQASLVVVARGQPGPGRPGGVRGRVLSVDEDQLTLGTPRGPVTVRVGPDTEIRVPGVENPTLGDVHVGDVVGARGTWGTDGVLEAQSLAVLAEGNSHPHDAPAAAPRPRD